VTKKTVMQSLSPLKKIMYVFLLQPLFVACSSSKEARVIVHGWNLCSESLNKKGGSDVCTDGRLC
jgi:hypothetical protein